jgi:hemerythrin
MAYIHWKDRYSINFREIDEQHKSLLATLNELIDLVGERGDPEAVSAIFSQLCQYALTHFATEEAYLAAANYPHLDQQKAEHGLFIQKLIDLNQSYDPTDPKLLDETLEFLKYWFVSHIMDSDMKYVPSLKKAKTQPLEVPGPESED